jgi:hypothetical protein
MSKLIMNAVYIQSQKQIFPELTCYKFTTYDKL